MNNKITKNLPLVVIFGRTNVGKSTFFNCLREKNQALISNIAGTTRDSNIGEVEWQKKTFELIDTGGIMDLKYLAGEKAKTDDIEAKVQEKAREMIKRADLILFMVDVQLGLLPQDRQMALMLKKIVKKSDSILLVANKTDKKSLRRELGDFYKLSLGEPIPISSATGSGTGDLLDIIVKKLPKIKTTKKTIETEADQTIKVCILGKPNVGKSSLLNSILGEERVIVSPTPHTTREPQDTLLNYKDRMIKLIDTAGISKKGRQRAYKKGEIKIALEKRGIAKSLKALHAADIALLVIDINEPITRQDSKVVEEIINRKKSLIIIANKWDSIKERDTEKYKEYIYDSFPFIRWAPIQFVSALTGEKTGKIMDIVLEVDEQRKRELTPSQANTFLMKIVKIHKPAKGKGTKHPHIHKFEQMSSNPPEFLLRIGSKDDIHFSYVRFIENRLRDRFGFLGTPIRIEVVKNRAIHGKSE